MGWRRYIPGQKRTRRAGRMKILEAPYFLPLQTSGHLVSLKKMRFSRGKLRAISVRVFGSDTEVSD